MLFTDNNSTVFLLLKRLTFKFSFDGLHAGYPLRYLKEPRELSVKLIELHETTTMHVRNIVTLMTKIYKTKGVESMTKIYKTKGWRVCFS